MSKRCVITGDSQCSCEWNPSETPLGSAMLMDMKASIRKVFTDHAVYTNWLILDSLPNLNSEAVTATTNRLLQNPTDIGNLLTPIVGKSKSLRVEHLFTEHLKLAAKILTLINTKQSIDKTVADFYKNGDEVAEGLSELNPTKLGLAYAKKLMHDHNEHVVQLVTIRTKKDYTGYIRRYDVYYKHILMFADSIYEALTN